MDITVNKKDGTTEEWDFAKIKSAITKSAVRVMEEFTQDQLDNIEAFVNSKFSNRRSIQVFEIHAAVEAALLQFAPKVAESYINYRNFKKTTVAEFEELYEKAKNTLLLDDRENANFDSKLTSTKGVLVMGYLTSLLYQKYYLSNEERQAIKDGYIYIHDLRSLIFGSLNCGLFDMGTVLKGGFEMSNVPYSEPNTLLSALQVIGDITLVATAQQYGGFTIPEIDKILIPYFKKSREKYRQDDKTFMIVGIDAYVESKVLTELRQGLQSLSLKLNTVTSSRGDIAFTTISFGNVDGDNEEDNRIQRIICNAILEDRMNPPKNGAPLKFPKLVYLHSEEQHKAVEQQALFEKALDCSTQCMYPDYLSLDHPEVSEVGEIFHRTGKAVSPMGCRAFLSDYVDENGESQFIGRANVGAVSLNLPMIWKKSEGKTFVQDLDKYLTIIRKFLQRRYEDIADKPCSTNPLAFTQGGLLKGFKNPSDKVGYDIVKQFTASFGITALNELNVLMTGNELHESDCRRVVKVVQHIKDRVEEFKKEDGYLYALYGTPAESLAGTQLNQFRDKFGVIPKVSDREYFTNSFHTQVAADITPHDKQMGEYELFHMINGGHIQYCVLENPSNKDALRDIVKRGMRLGYYQGVNFDIVVCEDCGYRTHKFDETCPSCKGNSIRSTVRICGYLQDKYVKGDTRINDAKLAEIRDRKNT